MTLDWLITVDSSSHGQLISFASDAKYLAVYSSGIKNKQKIYLIEVGSGKIIRSFNYRDMPTTIDFRHRYIVLAKNMQKPGYYNLYGQLPTATVGSSHLFSFLIDPNPLQQVTLNYAKLSKDLKTDFPYGLSLSKDNKRLYTFGTQFDLFAIGGYKAETGAQEWALSFDD